MHQKTWDVRLPRGLRDPVRKVAFDQNRPISHVVSDAIEEFLKNTTEVK